MKASKERRQKTQCGLTLVEVTVAAALTLLLFFGALDLYVGSARLSLNTAAACYAATDQANAVQHTVRDAEEARWLALPGESGWASPQNAPLSAFQAASGGTTIATGVLLMLPAVSAVSVQDRSGGTLAVSPLPYARTQDAAPPSPLWIYRADRDGTPDPAGVALWISGTEQGQAISKTLISSLSPTDANAVRFARPQTAAGTLLPYQLQISVSSTYFSPIQTPPAGSVPPQAGPAGKCVLLRDHEMNLDHEPASPANYGAINAAVVRSD